LSGLSDSERKSIEDNPLLPYGATLLAVLLTPHFGLYLQLGDGDILTVGPEGDVQRPLPPDDRSFANETASLCSSKGGGKGRPASGSGGAWADFRVRLVPHAPEGSQAPPAMVLVTTDGYPNAFRSDDDFIKVGPDLLQFVRDEGASEVRTNLPGWLEDASRTGSGDDVTLALVIGASARKPALGAEIAQRPSDVIAPAKDAQPLGSGADPGTAQPVTSPDSGGPAGKPKRWRFLPW
jgi:hypothetical protein